MSHSGDTVFLMITLIVNKIGLSNYLVMCQMAGIFGEDSSSSPG